MKGIARQVAGSRRSWRRSCGLGDRTWEGDGGVFEPASVEQDDPPDDLSDVAPGLLGELIGAVVTLHRRLPRDRDLDELMLLEGHGRRLHEPVSQAVLSDLNDRREVMARFAKGSALGSRQQDGARDGRRRIADGRDFRQLFFSGGG